MPEHNEYEDFDIDTSDGNDEKQSFIEQNRVSLMFALLGVISTGLGMFFYKDQVLPDGNEIEIIGVDKGADNENLLIVEIAGAVREPGVYEMENGSRIDDLIRFSGGLQDNADNEFLDKIINKAAKLTDGQKFYIPYVNEQSSGSSANSSAGGVRGYC